MNSDQKRLVSALFVTFIIFLAELIGGLIANSLALVSDAGHMLTDTLALIMALLAATFASRPATGKKTFGFYRLEILSSLFNGTALTLVSIYIFYQAYERFLHPSPVWSGLMLTIAVIGLFANLGAASMLAAGSRDNLNLRGAFIHVLSDMVSSIGVIIGGLIIQFTHWYYIDPILGVLIGCLILRGAISLVYDSANILLESTPTGIKFDAVVETICAVKGVKDIHDLHIWVITSGMNAISAHIVIDDEEIKKTAEILREIRKVLESKFKIEHATFQTECDSCSEDLFCHLERREEGNGHRH